jgi:Rrf2 family transcriptional regulator, cysteine metabolism repressor
MKISTRARYGTRALLDLALNQNEGIIQLKDIARRQTLSPSYLEHLFIPLIAAGLVKSTRGAKGGLALARPAEEIKLSEIVAALEGPICLVDCISATNACPRDGSCATQDFWGELNRAIGRVLESTTLAGLAEKQRQKSKATPNPYQI